MWRIKWKYLHTSPNNFDSFSNPFKFCFVTSHNNFARRIKRQIFMISKKKSVFPVAQYTRQTLFIFIQNQTFNFTCNPNALPIICDIIDNWCSIRKYLACHKILFSYIEHSNVLSHLFNFILICPSCLNRT